MDKLITIGKAYSKINIGLDILSETDSQTNKHHIKSLFYLYTKLFDEITIYAIVGVENDIIEYHNYYFDSNNCLIKKALKFLRKNKLINSYYHIIVDKKIPVQAGLGGGSSDCAFVLSKLSNSNLKKYWKDIALNLGSDVPFFLSNQKFAIVEGFGEIIRPVTINTNLKIGVNLCEWRFSTTEVFKQYLQQSNINNFNDYEKIIYNLNHNIYQLSAINVFFDVLSQNNKEWLAHYNSISSQHDFVIVSGSGGTIVTIDKPKRIRTRYAPSPTGYFHVGGARTAIFCYLFAKHNEGDFIVRIEDTDTARNVENGIRSQIDNLEWLGVKIDESLDNPNPKYGPYVQTQKLERYQDLAYSLLALGKAYYCFCDQKQLEEDRLDNIANHQTPRYSRRCLHLSELEINDKLEKNIPYVIRLKIDENQDYSWDDLVRGQISVPGTAMTDPVILKSNKLPMYNFAVVVDDYDMEITHVLRGEEHISNTPYQLAISNALSFDKNNIKYGHLSIIVNETGKKLSKRDQGTKQFIEDYKNMGFVPEAIFNFLSLLSWSSPDNREILSKSELIKLFDINRLSKSPTFFDYSKMLWLGNEYIKKMPDDEYLEFVKPFIKINLDDFYKNNIDMLLLLFKNQISYAKQLNELITEYFLIDYDLQDEHAQKIVHDNIDVVKCFADKINELPNWSVESIIDLINEVKEETNKKGKDLFMPIRIAATGLMHGPELAKIIFLKQQKPILFNIDKIKFN